MVNRACGAMYEEAWVKLVLLWQHRQKPTEQLSVPIAQLQKSLFIMAKQKLCAWKTVRSCWRVPFFPMQTRNEPFYNSVQMQSWTKTFSDALRGLRQKAA